MHWVQQLGQDRAAVSNLSEEKRFLQNTYKFITPLTFVTGRRRAPYGRAIRGKGKDEGACTAEWHWLFVGEPESGKKGQSTLTIHFSL
jgi:hypothetical protein